MKAIKSVWEFIKSFSPFNPDPPHRFPLALAILVTLVLSAIIVAELAGWIGTDPCE